jgi:hypothetical protein
MLTRRRFLILGVVSVAAVGNGGCSSKRSTGARATESTADYSSRFAAFERLARA